jgi:hypothetical protein
MRRAERVLIGVLLALATTVSAHDGGFGHSRRTLFVQATPDGWAVEYRIAANRDEALVELIHMDTNADGQVSADERDRWFLARAQQIAQQMQVHTEAGAAVPLKFVRCELGSSLTQTYHFLLTSDAPALLIDDRNFSHKPGLVQVRTGPGVATELAKPVDLTHAERVSVRIKKTATK